MCPMEGGGEVMLKFDPYFESKLHCMGQVLVLSRSTFTLVGVYQHHVFVVKFCRLYNTWRERTPLEL